MKNCNVCKIDKELLEFHKMKNSKDGYRSICKECRKVSDNKYKEINREIIRLNQREYARNNYESEKIRSQEWLKNNPERVIKRRKEWKIKNPDKVSKSIKRNNESYSHKCRMFLHSTLRRLNKKKENDTIDYLGYSAIEFKNRIEETFLDGMCWENHGKWHIDHIKPVSSFEENTPINIINALKNIRAMWAIDNLKKGNKIVESII